MNHVTTISDTADICTLINTFDVDPQKQHEIVASLRRFTIEASRYPGFIAASVHASLDGARVVNYVQWVTREDLGAMLRTEAAQRHMAEVAALADAVSPILYRVAFVGCRQMTSRAHRLPIGRVRLAVLFALWLAAPDPCSAQQAPQGYAPVFRYDDDFSFLADPASRTDPVDVFKYVPLLMAPGAYATFGLDDRERVEASANALLGFGFKRPQAYDLHRLLFDADLHLREVRLFVQVGSALEDGRRPGPIPLDVDRLDLQQGFADYRLAAAAGQLVLRAGRQEMSYDEGAIIGLRDGPNVRLSFDGVRASYVDPTYGLDLFAVRPVSVSPGAFDDGNLAGQALYGLHATVTPRTVTGFAIDAFVFGNTMPAVSLYPTTEAERTATFGTRLRYAGSGFDGSVGAIGQTGDYGGRDVLAYAAHVDAGYTFRDLPTNPGFTLRADVLSGSDDPGHGTVHTFNALYPNVAYSTEATIEAPANLIEPAVLLFSQPVADLRVQYILEGLWRYSTADAFYAAPLVPLTPGNSSTARFVGLEQQISATWRLSEHVAITAAYVHFLAGDFVARGGGRSEDFGMTEVNFRF